MAAPKIGSTTDDLTSVGRRDAFHFPGVLVTSDHALEPKQDVRFTDSSCTKVEPAHENERMAVVDPFVTAAHIPTGLAFWVFLAPGFVDNLVHHFEIRDFQSNDVTVKTSSDVRRLEEEAQNDKKLSADRALQHGGGECDWTRCGRLLKIILVLLAMSATGVVNINQEYLADTDWYERVILVRSS